MTRIKTVGDIRKLIESLPDDFEIEMRLVRELTEEEALKRNPQYPYPFVTDYEASLNFDDIGYSDKVVCFSSVVNMNNLE